MGKKVSFLIIGVTGPIGSGCTTLAKNIVKVEPNKYIKGRKLYENTVSEIESISSKIKELRERNNTEDEYKIKQLNAELLKHIEEREYLKNIQKIDDPKFIYISLSALIIKLAVENLNTNEFNEWKKKEVNNEISEILLNFKTKWKSEIDLYDKSIKKFDELDNTSLKKIDSMFQELKEVLKRVKDIELELYYSGKIDEFYLQSFGNNLRRTGNAFNNEGKPEEIDKNINIISKEANTLIKYYRNRKDENKANCFVIDAFRNPYEIEFFRRYEQFYLVSLYADRDVRQSRIRKELKNQIDLDDEKFRARFEKLDGLDWGNDIDESSVFKQNVSRCCYLSDVAINNDKETGYFDDELFKKFLRYYALIISPGCIQPTKEEMYMNLAYSLSLRSSCISRKVGAVITDNEGYVLGLGWNDVAHSQIGCGLKCKDDFVGENELLNMELFKGIVSSEDLRRFSASDSICFKDIFSKITIKEKLNKTNKFSEEEKDKVLQNLNLKRLEYCRSLHAEENALLQVASRGGMGVNGGIIYTTTFPCELCAKKIYQSGISKIYYTEPYPNSISENIFLKDGIRNVTIKQFEGVKSFSYFKLYRPRLDKKEAQKIDYMFSSNLYY